MALFQAWRLHFDGAWSFRKTGFHYRIKSGDRLFPDHALKRHAGRPHDDAYRVLVEFAPIGGDDGIEARVVVFIAGQHDLDVLRRLTHDPAAVAIAPLSDGVDDGQAVGKARYQFAPDEKLPR